MATKNASVNHWRTDKCAKAFWDQKNGRPYQELLADTIRWAAPRPGESWMDLGCGSGHLAGALLTATGGALRQVTCIDIAEANRQPLDRLARTVRGGHVITFLQADFSNGLGMFADASFDGVVSGLSLSYAQSTDPITGAYTNAAFRKALAETRRVLKPSGRFVFSINVPNPKFWRVFYATVRQGLRISKPGRLAINALRMHWYGQWLCREAKRGRFHYLPIEELHRLLTEAGFGDIEHKLSYVDQAYVVRARPIEQGQSSAA